MRIIAGKLKDKAIRLPKQGELRPTTGRLRESVFNICQGAMEGVRALDLFAGSGAMGLEALSRGAASCVFVEGDKEAVQCIRMTLSDCTAAIGAAASCRVIQSDVVATLQALIKQQQHFDWIYVDPPYGALSPSAVPYSHLILQMIDSSSLLTEGGYLFIEETAEAAPGQAQQLSRLTLSSSRRIGRSILLHYIAKPSTISEVPCPPHSPH